MIERASARALQRVMRGIYLARRALRARDHENRMARGTPQPNARNVLFITSDQQRFDALGVNGGRVARTPNLDALARAGINYRRAHVQNVVCMPSRATMLTGQHPRTHGVIANGIALPDDAPSVAAYLRERGGYRTALVGKAHFDPHLDPLLRFHENRRAAEGWTSIWHGFEHLELASHGPISGHHYGAWLWDNHPQDVNGFGGVLTGAGGGDTHAPEVTHNPIDRSRYHTDWIADRTLAWLRSLNDDEPFFCWMSFPDPHHPFDPPIDEVRARIDWRDLELPKGHPGTRERIQQLLSKRPRHWLDWYEGRFRNPEGGPTRFVPAELTHDQVREVNAMIHVENELIDDAIGRVLAWLRHTGRDDRTDIVYTSDHGELQGDLGLMFKGPYHIDALLRVPLVWRPAPCANVPSAEVSEPVGLVDLAPTFCGIAGLDTPEWVEGTALPTSKNQSRERVLTTFDSQFAHVGMHLRTIYRDGFICTVYTPRSQEGGGRFPVYWSVWGRGSRIPEYDGSEGELYDVGEDPHQWHNLWNDPSRRRLRDELTADLQAHTPPLRVSLPVAAPT
ncbi:MAG TPA: sulfatase-like hydrolase/transferase [Polyangiaceae bacterium]|nr:sulfatase-like hydrolase/transferase [Polyangiaceae bacterium]